MGIFYSYCPQCSERISWFLYTPQNYICEKCKTPVTEEEFKNSLFLKFDSYGGNTYEKQIINLLIKKRIEKGTHWYNNHSEEMAIRFLHEHLNMFPLLKVEDLKYAFKFEDVYNEFVDEWKNKRL